MLLDDAIDVDGMATSGGSIALQNSMPTDDSTIVAKLKAAGAIVLGKTNVTELNGMFDANMPEGYSSLGGQVLVPSDTDKTPAGSSGGSAAATAAGLAAMTVGMETSPDTAQLIAPAGVNGVVGLKPTVGLVSRAGVLPVAKSQDSPGPIGRTVYDVAAELDVIAGPDPRDPATAGTPARPDYTAGLSTSALQGKRIAVIASTTAPYPTMVGELQALGATTTVVTIATPVPTAEHRPDRVQARPERLPVRHPRSGRQDVAGDHRLQHRQPGRGPQVPAGRTAGRAGRRPVRPGAAATYAANLATGKASTQAVIDTILNNGTPADPSDDFDAIMVPSGNASVGSRPAGYPVLTSRPGTVRPPAPRARPDRRHLRRHGVQRGPAARRRVRARAGDERAARAELHEPEHVALRPRKHVLHGRAVQPGRPAARTDVVLPALATRIAGMGLSRGVAADLTHRLDDAARRLHPSTAACGDLDDLIRTVSDDAGHGRLTPAQAETILTTLKSVEGTIGCHDGG